MENYGIMEKTIWYYTENYGTSIYYGKKLWYYGKKLLYYYFVKAILIRITKRWNELENYDIYKDYTLYMTLFATPRQKKMGDCWCPMTFSRIKKDVAKLFETLKSI